MLVTFSSYFSSSSEHRDLLELMDENLSLPVINDVATKTDAIAGTGTAAGQVGAKAKSNTATAKLPKLQQVGENLVVESDQQSHDNHPSKSSSEQTQAQSSDTRAGNGNTKGKDNNKNETKDNNDNNNERLNLVILYGDDWTLKTLGLLNSAVKTPNLDQLASRGMLFTHNCVTTSICMVSRATLYTGQYASRHKTYLPEDTAMFAKGVWNETLFSLLKQNGYHTGMVGKWHHTAPAPVQKTFNTFKNYYGKHFITRKNVTKHITTWNEEDALEFLDTRPRDKHFALLVSFFAIHADDGDRERYFPQSTSMSLYVNDTIPTPKTATDKHFQDLPYFFKNGQNFGRGRWQGRYSTPKLYQKMMKVCIPTMYYSCRDGSLFLLSEAPLCENLSPADIMSRFYDSMLLTEYVSHGHRSRCNVRKNPRRTQSTKCARQDAGDIHYGQWQSSWYDTKVVVSRVGFMDVFVCFCLFFVVALSF